MKKLKIIIVFFILIGFIGYNYLYKSHRNIESEKPKFSINSSEILNEFSLDMDQSSSKYLNKTIAIKGSITGIEGAMISLDDKIVCYMLDSNYLEIELNSIIEIKGRFIGYDELLEELKFDQCSIVKHKN